MTPAVHEMTVKEERACLSEIRENNSDISYKHLLHNGWTAGHFALKYVTGHYRKRKSKEQSADKEEIQVVYLGDCAHSYGDERGERKGEESAYLSDPFSRRPDTVKDIQTRQTKRTQRYRSTAKSRILGMTVGDIRYCFQQLRNAGESLTQELVLYNGQCAGEFALCYLIETSNSMRNKKKRETNLAREEEEATRVLNYPATQLPQTCTRAKTHNGNVTFS